MPWDSDKMLIILSYMGVSKNSGTPKHPKMIILEGKPMVVGYHHFRKTPYIRAYPKKLALLGCDRPLQYLRGISPPRSVSLNQVTSDAVLKTLPSIQLVLIQHNQSIHHRSIHANVALFIKGEFHKYCYLWLLQGI